MAGASGDTERGGGYPGPGVPMGHTLLFSHRGSQDICFSFPVYLTEKNKGSQTWGQSRTSETKQQCQAQGSGVLLWVSVLRALHTM